MEKSGFRDKIDAEVERNAGMTPAFTLMSIWEWECYDKDGNLKWTEKNHNRVVTEGLNRILDVMFRGTTQTNPWYVCLFKDDHTPVAADNYDVPGYTELAAADYTEAARQAYVEAAAAAGVMTNSANKATFTMAGSFTVYGGALVSVVTAADHAAGANNVLFCESQFASGSKAVVAGDTIKTTITITATNV